MCVYDDDDDDDVSKKLLIVRFIGRRIKSEEHTRERLSISRKRLYSFFFLLFFSSLHLKDALKKSAPTSVSPKKGGLEKTHLLRT